MISHQETAICQLSDHLCSQSLSLSKLLSTSASGHTLPSIGVKIYSLLDKYMYVAFYQCPPNTFSPMTKISLNFTRDMVSKHICVYNLPLNVDFGSSIPECAT